MEDEGDSDMFDEKERDIMEKINWQQIFLQERMMGEPQSIP
jgi:hypothetical protein